jgi:hypothetical protein
MTEEFECEDKCWWAKLGDCLDHILIFCPKK